MVSLQLSRVRRTNKQRLEKKKKHNNDNQFEETATEQAVSEEDIYVQQKSQEAAECMNIQSTSVPLSIER